MARELILDWDTLVLATDPEQQLIIWTAERGSPTHDALRFLAAWSTAAANTP